MNKRASYILLTLMITYYLWMLLTPYSQDSVEGILLAHQRSGYPRTLEESKQKAHIPLYGRLYYSLTESPNASLLRGRLFSFLALGVITVLLLQRPHHHKRVPLLALLLLQAPLLRFGVTNRVDLLAICLVISAFVLYQKWRTSLSTLKTTTIVLILVVGFYLKQTAIVPVSLILCFDLWRHKRYSYLIPGTVFMATLILLPMVHNRLLWIFMVQGNVNTIDLSNWLSIVMQLIPMFVIILIGMRNSSSSLVKWYLFVSILFALLSATKSGSNLNYFIEPAIVSVFLFSDPKRRFKKGGVVFATLFLGALPAMYHSIQNYQQCRNAVMRYRSFEEGTTILAMDCTPILIANQNIAIVDLHISKQHWKSSLVDTTVLLQKAHSADLSDLISSDIQFAPSSIIAIAKEAPSEKL